MERNSCSFSYKSRFLPRNLLEDFDFRNWQEVLDFYEQNEPWFLHPQLAEDLGILKKAFEDAVSKLD